MSVSFQLNEITLNTNLCKLSSNKSQNLIVRLFLLAGVYPNGPKYPTCSLFPNIHFTFGYRNSPVHWNLGLESTDLKQIVWNGTLLPTTNVGANTEPGSGFPQSGPWLGSPPQATVGLRRESKHPPVSSFQVPLSCIIQLDTIRPPSFDFSTT